MRISQNGIPEQESSYWATPQADGPRNNSGVRYTGAPISVNFKDADLKSVLQAFAKITSADIQYPPDLQGKVTLDVADMPWDQAFDIILQQQHLTWESTEKGFRIKRQ